MFKADIYNNFVYKTKFNFDYDKIKSVCDLMLDVKGKFPEEYVHKNSYSSYHNPVQPHKLKEFQDYYEFIKPIYTDIIFNKWNYPKNENVEYKISNSLIAKYDKNGYITEHNHEEAVCVIVGYIKLKKNGGIIKMRDPFYEFKKNLINTKDDDWLWQSVEVEESDIIFFPGAMWHKTLPNLSNSERIIISTNINIQKEKNNCII